MWCGSWQNARSPDELNIVAESLESLRGSFNRSF
jgi:hypothetical protein